LAAKPPMTRKRRKKRAFFIKIEISFSEQI